MNRNFRHFCANVLVGSCLCLIFISCEEDDQLGSFKDPRDNKAYKTLNAGGQVWFAEDLRFEDSTLYSYQQGLNACPPGWSLPNKADWIGLNNYFGGYIEDGEEIGNPTAAYNRMFAEFGVEEESYYWTSSPAWDDMASIRSSAFRLSSFLKAVEYTPTLVHIRMRCRCVKKEVTDNPGDIIQFKINNEEKVFDLYRINYPEVSGQADLFLHGKLDKPELADRAEFHFTIPSGFVSALNEPVIVTGGRISYQFSSFPDWNWFSQSAIDSEDLEVLITFYNGSVVMGTFSGTTFDGAAITDGTFELSIN